MNAHGLCRIFDCNTCAFKDAGLCPGCVPGNELRLTEKQEACSIYRCVTERGIASCDVCAQIDCPIEHQVGAICPLRSAFEDEKWWARRIAESLCGRVDRDRGPRPMRRISDRTVTRLRWYLLALEDMAAKGATVVSSKEIADHVGVSAALVRKDLSYFGDFGTPSFGYRLRYLEDKITEILHLNVGRNIIWVGAKRLLDNTSLFDELHRHNCHIVAVLDSNDSFVGVRVNNLQVLHVSSLRQVVQNLDADAAVLAVTLDQAQSVANALVTAGIKAILNLSSVPLHLPSGVNVRNVDIAGELMALSFYTNRGLEQSRDVMNDE